MTRAVALQVKRDLCPAWGIQLLFVVYLGSEKDAQSGMQVIAVLDSSDQAGALGWHTEDQGELVYGRVFAQPVLENGGDGTPSRSRSPLC